MMETDVLVIRQIKTESKRIFSLKFVSFENGFFIVLAEGSDRIGSLSVSISSSNKVNTARVIPSKYDSLFISTISERVSSMVNGICIVSLYSMKQLSLDDMKAIMGEILNIVEESCNENNKKTRLGGFKQ